MLNISVQRAQPVPRQCFCNQLDDRSAAYKEVFDKLRNDCPYRADRLARGLEVDQDCGPDWPDMFAHQATILAAGLQARCTTQATHRQSLLPYGLPPETHACLAEALTSPLTDNVILADGLDFAIRSTMQQGTNIGSWRRKHMRIIQRAIRRLHQLNDILAESRSVSARRTSSHLHLAGHDITRYSVCWPDHTIMNLLH